MLEKFFTFKGTKRVYLFHEGSASDYALLGNKGANLCEMFNMKIPVPPGFIITTETCIDYYYAAEEEASGVKTETSSSWQTLADELVDEYTRAIHELENQTGRHFGIIGPSATYAKTLSDTDECDSYFPLLLSVRAGGAVSMPGMLDTVLNLGMNDDVVLRLLHLTNNARFAFDTYRRFLQMFGVEVFGVDKKRYEEILSEVCSQRGVKQASDLNIADIQIIIHRFKELAHVPSDPWDQLRLAIIAGFNSWFTPRAISYREIHGIPDNVGTAVTVQSMVYGNMNDRSGSGVCFTRNPSTGAPVLSCEYLVNAEGEDVVDGVRTPLTIETLKRDLPSVHHSLTDIASKLEKHFRDMQDIEFTVENGHLFILQTRSGKRTTKASVRIAVELAMDKVITEREALLRVNAREMDFFLRNTIDPLPEMSDPEQFLARRLGKGCPASNGAASGAIVFSCDEALALAAQGKRVILCREETSADDIAGIQVADGVLTAKGGITSHAAVAARQFDKPAVTGAGAMASGGVCPVSGICIDTVARILSCSLPKTSTTAAESKVGVAGDKGTQESGEDVFRMTLTSGDLITIDGSSGCVFKGEMDMTPVGVDLCFQTLVGWAEKYKRMDVLAVAESIEDVRKAKLFGASGIGLFRTDAMFRDQDSLDFTLRYILATDEEQRKKILDSMIPGHIQYYLTILRMVHGCPIRFCLLNSPLMDFLPRYNSNSHDIDVSTIAARLGLDETDTLRRVRELHEDNPLLGVRGCRLLVLRPEILQMQVEALVEAMILAVADGVRVCPEIVLPFVCSDQEIRVLVPKIQHSAASVYACHGLEDLTGNSADLGYAVGGLVEAPRACFASSKNVSSLLGVKSSVIFDTTSLTELVYGFSKVDSSHFLSVYMDKHIFADDPFKTLDQRAVGVLLREAVERELANDGTPEAAKQYQVGICGDHCSDAASIQFFDQLGVSFIACNTDSVPLAKIAAAQAGIRATSDHKSGQKGVWNMFSRSAFPLLPMPMTPI